MCKLFSFFFLTLITNTICYLMTNLTGIQTDDVGFFCSPVSQEYYLASKHFGLARADLIGLCKRGINSIFGGSHEKNRLLTLLAEFSESKI